MPDAQHSALNREVFASLTIDGQEAAGGLAASPWAMPGFFAGWIGVGVVLALVLVRRGHDARTMIAIGAGLGPLMTLVVSETIRHREIDAQPLVLRSGVDRGGPLDVLVLVPDEHGGIEDLRTAIESARGELGLLTVGRAVSYEWVEGDLDNDVVHAGERELHDAATRLMVPDAELALLPGRIDTVIERFRRREGRTLVLVAVPLESPAPRNP